MRVHRYIGAVALAALPMAAQADASSAMSHASGLVALSKSMDSLVQLLQWAMYGIGMVFAVQALMDSMSKSNGMMGPQNEGGRILSRFIFAAAFMASGYTLSLLKTAATTGAWNDFGLYGGGASTDPFAEFGLAIVRLVQFYGGYSMFKGLLVWKSAGDQQAGGQGDDKAMSGATHVFFGGLCADCVNTYRGIAGFMNFPVPSFFPT